MSSKWSKVSNLFGINFHFIEFECFFELFAGEITRVRFVHAVKELRLEKSWFKTAVFFAAKFGVEDEDEELELGF